MSVSCSNCGQTWPRDPALEVACPTCNRPVGKACVRPSQHETYGRQPHAARDRLAMREVEGYVQCPAARAGST